MARGVDRRINDLEDYYDGRGEDHSWYIRRRIVAGYLNELDALTRKSVLGAETLPSEAARLWGEDYSSDEAHEEAVRRLVAKLEARYLRPGWCTHHDLVPHAPQWWFDPEHEAELIQVLSEGILAFHVSILSPARKRGCNK